MAAVLKLYDYNFTTFILSIFNRKDFEDVKDVEENFFLALIGNNITKVQICEELDVLLVERVSILLVKLRMKPNDKKNIGQTV